MAARTVSRRQETPEIIERLFKLRANATTVSTEVIGGITTFSYDAGRLVGIARPNRRTTGYQYGFTAIADRPAMGT